MENYFNKLSFPPDFPSLHFFSNTLRHSVKITILFDFSFTLCLGEKKQLRKLAHLCILWCQQNLHQIHVHISQYRNSCMCGRGKCTTHLALRFYLFNFFFKCKMYLMYNQRSLFYLFIFSFLLHFFTALVQMKCLTAMTTKLALLNASVSAVAGDD